MPTQRQINQHCFFYVRIALRSKAFFIKALGVFYIRTNIQGNP